MGCLSHTPIANATTSRSATWRKNGGRDGRCSGRGPLLGRAKEPFSPGQQENRLLRKKEELTTRGDGSPCSKKVAAHMFKIN